MGVLREVRIAKTEGVSRLFVRHSSLSRREERGGSKGRELFCRLEMPYGNSGIYFRFLLNIDPAHTDLPFSFQLGFAP